MRKLPLMSLLSTTTMTLFSYSITLLSKHNFVEPQLLNGFFFPRRKKQKKNNMLGYLAHWLVGWFFTLGYHFLWKNNILRNDYKTSSTIGFFNGLVGIAGWHLFFLVHKDPPKIHLRKYYLQLVGAHVVFGLTNGWVYGKKAPGLGMHTINEPLKYQQRNVEKKQLV